jgi:signal transduction histidine kinase
VVTSREATETEGTAVRGSAETAHGGSPSGESVPVASSFDLHSMLADAAREFAPSARDRGTSLELKVAATVPPTAIGDEALLRKVLFGLIDNAVKLTDDGEVVASVSSAEARGGRALLYVEVSDTGSGAVATAPEGRLVDLMDGQFGRSSSAGLGTTAWFKVPLDVPAG